MCTLTMAMKFQNFWQATLMHLVRLKRQHGFEAATGLAVWGSMVLPKLEAKVRLQTTKF